LAGWAAVCRLFFMWKVGVGSVSALDGAELPASHTGRLDLGDKRPGCPWSFGHGAGLGVATNKTSLPTGTPSLSLRSSRLTTCSQNGRRVGVLTSAMWRFVVTDVSSLNPERQIAHGTQSSLSLPWGDKISYSHYTDRGTRLSIFNIIRFISEWLRLQQFRLEGLAFKY
jgi:hypothetical protein